MQTYRCDVCGEYTERNLSIVFHDSLYSAGSVDLCPRCMSVAIDEFRNHISSPYYGEARKRFDEIETRLNMVTVRIEKGGDETL